MRSRLCLVVLFLLTAPLGAATFASTPAADDPALPALDDADQAGVVAPVIAAIPIDLPELSPPDSRARYEDERPALVADSASAETTSPRPPPLP